MEKVRGTMKEQHIHKSGRPLKKPNYDAAAILQDTVEQAVRYYTIFGDKRAGDAKHRSLAEIGRLMEMNPIKVRKLLIMAGVYESDIADHVNAVFAKHRAKLSYKEALKQTCMETGLSRASVNSYLPYEKGIYMPEDCSPDEISVGAERIRRFRRKNATP